MKLAAGLAMLALALVVPLDALAKPPRGAIVPVAAARSSFTAKDKANATALIRFTASGLQRYAYCRLSRNRRTMDCRSSTHPVLANRYYRERHTWKITGGRITLTYKRETQTILIAEVSSISTTSFMLERIIYPRSKP